MTITDRRSFIKTTAACAAFAPYCASWAAQGKPTLRVGLMTDTHVGKTRETCSLVRKALELFRELKTDAIANLGDIADRYFPSGYGCYRKEIEEVFPDKGTRPRMLFVFANHDRIDWPGSEKEAQWMACFEDVRERLGAENGIWDSFEMRGLPFIVAPQFLDIGRYEKMIADACAAHPGRPVFLLDHVPAFDTVYNSCTWGDRKRRTVLDKYPQVVQLSGHVHGSNRNELNIWQGNFTVVSAGCLQVWNGELVGNSPSSKRDDGVLVMDVFEDRLVFHRWSLNAHVEFRPSEPWCVPLPFAASSAPYALSRRKAESTPPQFAAGASLSIAPEGTPCRKVVLNFPEAEHRDRTFRYRIEIARAKGGGWETFARRDEFGDFYLLEDARTGIQRQSFSCGYFDAGCEYVFKVVPEGFFGQVGRPLEARFKAPEMAKTDVVFESNNPMADCRFLSGLDGGAPLPREGEWYRHRSGNARLEFPDDVWKGPRGTFFRFTIDQRTIQNGDKRWTLVLRNPVPLQNANDRISTPPGDSGIQRYVVEFRKPADNWSFYWLVREGGDGLVRFEHVKIERL